jgi:hypothetical protein
MKFLIKHSVLMFIATLISANTFAYSEKEFHPDTIRLELANKATIEYRNTYDGVHNLISGIQLNDILNTFLKRWETLNIKNLDSTKAIHIQCIMKKEYLENKQQVISIQEATLKKQVTFPLDKAIALVVSGKNRVELNQQIAIYFDNVEQLYEISKLDLPTIFNNADKELHKIKDYVLNNTPLIAWLKVNNKNEVNLVYKELDRPSSVDQLAIFGGTSLENIKGDWNPGIQVNLTMYIGSKYITKHAIGFEYEWIFDFSSDKQHINHWTNISYHYNLSKKANNYNWLGLSVGYLAKKEGDLFDKDTFKIGISKKIHKNISIAPQFYFNEFFKDIYPGFKIKVHL